MMMDEMEMIPNGGVSSATGVVARNHKVYGQSNVKHVRVNTTGVSSSTGMMIKTSEHQHQIENELRTITPTPTASVSTSVTGMRVYRNKKRTRWQNDNIMNNDDDNDDIVDDEMESEEEEDDTYDSSDVECSKVRKRNKVYPPWSVDEDKVILDLQKDLGNNWVEISRQLKGRSRLDVKSRHRSLVRAFNRMWKPEEDKIVLQCHAEFKGDWVEQASKMINRSRNAIRVRFKELTENKILSKAKHIAKQGSPNQLFSQSKSQSSISPMLPIAKEQRINNGVTKNEKKSDLIGNSNSSSYPQPQSASSVAPNIGTDPLMSSTNMVSHITIPNYHSQSQLQLQFNPYQINGHGNSNNKNKQQTTFNPIPDLSVRYGQNNNSMKNNTFMLFGAPDNAVMNPSTQYDNGNAIMNKINDNMMTTTPIATATTTANAQKKMMMQDTNNTTSFLKSNNNNDTYLLSSPMSDCMLTPLHIPLYFDEDELDTLLQCLV